MEFDEEHQILSMNQLNRTKMTDHSDSEPDEPIDLRKSNSRRR